MVNGKMELDSLLAVLQGKIWPGTADVDERMKVESQVEHAVQAIIHSLEERSKRRGCGNQWFGYISSGDISLRIIKGPGRKDGIKNYNPSRGKLGGYVQTMIAYHLISARRRFGKEISLPDREPRANVGHNPPPVVDIEEMRKRFRQALGIFGILVRGRGLRAVVLEALLGFIEEAGNFRPSYKELHRKLCERGIVRHERYVLHVQHEIYDWIKKNSTVLEAMHDGIRFALEQYSHQMSPSNAHRKIVELLLMEGWRNQSFYFTESTACTLAGSDGFPSTVIEILGLRNRVFSQVAMMARLKKWNKNTDSIGK